MELKTFQIKKITKNDKVGYTYIQSKLKLEHL